MMVVEMMVTEAREWLLNRVDEDGQEGQALMRSGHRGRAEEEKGAVMRAMSKDRQGAYQTLPGELAARSVGMRPQHGPLQEKKGT